MKWILLVQRPSLVWGFGDREREPPAEAGIIEVRQVHGRSVIDADGLPAGLQDLDADGLSVSRPGRLAAVRTADCVPVLLAGVHEDRRWAAAVHAGWRGTAAGIVSVAVEAAAAAGVPADALVAMLGPSIGPCCYEVGDEVVAAMKGLELDAAVLPGEGAGPRVDLREANRELLVRSGLHPHNIRYEGPCTRCARDRYFSYRAEPGEPGRQRSWVGWMK